MVIFFVCLVPVRLLLSSTAGFVPREWLAAKGLSQLLKHLQDCLFRCLILRDYVPPVGSFRANYSKIDCERSFRCVGRFDYQASCGKMSPPSISPTPTPERAEGWKTRHRRRQKSVESSSEPRVGLRPFFFFPTGTEARRNEAPTMPEILRFA